MVKRLDVVAVDEPCGYHEDGVLHHKIQDGMLVHSCHDTQRLEQEEDVKDGVCMYSIIVEDTGIGMSKDFMAGMFESFVRENREEVMKESGVGLGLAITKRLVTLMNGTITVSSELGNGSVFTVKLPLKIQSEEEVETREAEVIHDPKSLEGKKIIPTPYSRSLPMFIPSFFVIFLKYL